MQSQQNEIDQAQQQVAILNQQLKDFREEHGFWQYEQVLDQAEQLGIGVRNHWAQNSTRLNQELEQAGFDLNGLTLNDFSFEIIESQLQISATHSQTGQSQVYVIEDWSEWSEHNALQFNDGSRYSLQGLLDAYDITADSGRVDIGVGAEHNSPVKAASLDMADTTRLTIKGGEGNDVILSNQWVSWLEGAGGDDQLVGNLLDNHFIGGSGADQISGGGGDDTADYSTVLRESTLILILALARVVMPRVIVCSVLSNFKAVTTMTF